MASTKVLKYKEKSEERKQAIEAAEEDEIWQLFIDLCALQPEFKREIAGAELYNCHLYSVEKFLADGSHDKFKTRMVLNRDEQDEELFPY